MIVAVVAANNMFLAQMASRVTHTLSGVVAIVSARTGAVAVVMTARAAKKTLHITIFDVRVRTLSFASLVRGGGFRKTLERCHAQLSKIAAKHIEKNNLSRLGRTADSRSYNSRTSYKELSCVNQNYRVRAVQL